MVFSPGDNFNLETSHVLPALIRKIHLAICLEKNYWDAIRKDLDKRPIEGIDGSADDETILNLLRKYNLHCYQSLVTCFWLPITKNRLPITELLLTLAHFSSLYTLVTALLL